MEVPDSKIRRLSREEVDQVIDKVIPYITDPDDRTWVWMVSKSWKKEDDETREHVKLSLCYAATPAQLSRRFPNLKYLKTHRSVSVFRRQPQQPPLAVEPRESPPRYFRRPRPKDYSSEASLDRRDFATLADTPRPSLSEKKAGSLPLPQASPNQI